MFESGVGIGQSPNEEEDEHVDWTTRSNGVLRNAKSVLSVGGEWFLLGDISIFNNWGLALLKI